MNLLHWIRRTLRGQRKGRPGHARDAMQEEKQSPHANPCPYRKRPPLPAQPPPKAMPR